MNKWEPVPEEPVENLDFEAVNRTMLPYWLLETLVRLRRNVLLTKPVWNNVRKGFEQAQELLNSDAELLETRQNLTILLSEDVLFEANLVNAQFVKAWTRLINAEPYSKTRHLRCLEAETLFRVKDEYTVKVTERYIMNKLSEPVLTVENIHNEFNEPSEFISDVYGTSMYFLNILTTHNNKSFQIQNNRHLNFIIDALSAFLDHKWVYILDVNIHPYTISDMWYMRRIGLTDEEMDAMEEEELRAQKSKPLELPLLSNISPRFLNKLKKLEIVDDHPPSAKFASWFY